MWHSRPRLCYAASKFHRLPDNTAEGGCATFFTIFHKRSGLLSDFAAEFDRFREEEFAEALAVE
jgi:hypothetical protein